MLAELANKIAQTPPPARDAEAEAYIRSTIGRRPDALYLMTQTVLIQNMALQRAQQQIQELQQRVSQPVPQSGGSFLGQGPAQYSNAPQYGGQQYPAQPSYGAPPAYGAPSPAPSAMGGFLRSAAQTAAGVAAGTLAVQGIESLFSHHSGFGGGGFGGFGGGQPVEEIIENNYYGSDPHESRGSERFADASGSSDVANSLGPQDADYDNSTDDSADDSSDDSYDDSGDDSSGGDNFA
jgi:hypothetical protein